MNTYSFTKELIASDSQTVRARIEPILKKRFNPSVIKWSGIECNDGGADCVLTIGSKEIRIDLKIRKIDYLVREGKDDLAIETYSCIELSTPGWALDDSKSTDFVLWFWLDSGRHHILPFRPLRAAMKRFLTMFVAVCPLKKQRTINKGHEYTSACIIVPRDMLWRGILMALSEGLCNRKKKLEA